MRLRNKETGEIVDKSLFINYNSLAELNAEWEDYEEPKGIKSIGTIGSSVHIEMGSEEEAEKAARFWVKRYYYPNGNKWEIIGNIHEDNGLLGGEE